MRRRPGSLLLCLAHAVVAAGGCERETPARRPVSVTAVSGPSWLSRLGLEVDQTLLGHLGGDVAAPGPSRPEPRPRPGTEVWFELSGGDLYRFLCRSCHGPDGSGRPPLVGSALAGAAASSPELMMQRMAERGTPITAQMARELASGARASLERRLQQGGKQMPAFAYLRPDESAAVLRYLQKLAGAPVGESRIAEPDRRVGELVARGTCHLCHDATAADRKPPFGAPPMPTLASFQLLPRPWLIAKVRQDLPDRRLHFGPAGIGPGGTYGSPPRMPVMPYLSGQELDAVYDYLAAMPPRSAPTDSRLSAERR
jgi:mono/diheme cytochrome c family protein